MRKFWFAYLAKSLVIFPGGFGTIDEMFEILTLAQTRKLSKKLLVILYGNEYWNEVFHLEPLAEWGAINEDDLNLLCRVNTVDEAFEELRAFLTRHHMVPQTRQETKAPGIAKTRG
jgi:predicted Rossmann-fold nucleotide-binding protein